MVVGGVSLAVGVVSLAATPSHAALSTSGMTLSLPSSPRFALDQLDVRLTASLIDVNYGLRSWTVTLRTLGASLRLLWHRVDSVWGDAQVTHTLGFLHADFRLCRCASVFRSPTPL